MDLSVLLTSLPLPFAAALQEVVRLGFRNIDLVAQANRDDADVEALAESGLRVRCARLGHGLRLDAPVIEGRRQAVEQAKAQLSDAARLGAEFAYLVPGTRAEDLDAFADACRALASAAGRRMVRLCVEPMPGSALSSAIATLAWLQADELVEVGLLLDVGHCLISGEDPAAVVRAAGERLSYIHLDDYDGCSDLHWPLLTGRLTEAGLREFGAALRMLRFRGGIALELNPMVPTAAENLAASKAIAQRALGASP